MPAGRPSSYDPAYCEQVIEYLGRGHSIMAFAGEIGVTRQTVHNWMNENDEFFDAVKTGQAKAAAVWESVLLTVARDGGGNATARMEVRFCYGAASRQNRSRVRCVRCLHGTEPV
jgi:hypothetical protein